MNSQTFKYIPIIDICRPINQYSGHYVYSCQSCCFFSLFWEAKCSISLYFNSNLMKTLKFSTRLQHFGECLWWRSRPTFLILYTIREGMLPRDCMPTCSSIVYVLFLFLKSSFQHGCLFKHILENYGFTNIADDYLWWNLVGTGSALCGKMSVFKNFFTIWAFSMCLFVSVADECEEQILRYVHRV